MGRGQSFYTGENRKGFLMEIILVSVSIIVMAWLLFENYVLRKRLEILARRNEDLEIERIQKEFNELLINLAKNAETKRVVEPCE